MVDRNSFLWSYLQPEIRQLIGDGELLVEAVKNDGLLTQIADFSFLVFPFSKAYEGFLKKLFLDIGMIEYEDYYGDEMRIGRLLNPHYKHESKNVFVKLCSHSSEGKHLSQHLWDVWKNARNLVFHYFPHNFKRLTFEEANHQIEGILTAMDLAVTGCRLNSGTVQPKKRKS